MKAPKNEGGDFFTVPEGMYEAVCGYIVDCGYHKREFQGETSQKRMIWLRWELPNVLLPDGEFAGEPAVVGRTVTFSMHSKATLRQMLESWRGKSFSDEEAYDFDVAKLLNVNAKLQIIHRKVVVDGKERVYANINLVLPGDTDHKAKQTLVFDTEAPGAHEQFDELPEHVKRRINMPTQPKPREFIDQKVHDYADVISSQVAAEEDLNDDIPF